MLLTFMEALLKEVSLIIIISSRNESISIVCLAGGNIVILVVAKLHICYQLGGAGYGLKRILGLHFSGCSGSVSHHAKSLAVCSP